MAAAVSGFESRDSLHKHVQKSLALSSQKFQASYNTPKISKKCLGVVFFSSAAVAVTVLSWSLIEQIDSYLVWRRKLYDSRTNRDPRPNYSVAVRLGMLAWLARNGHWSWMCKTRT